MTKEDWDRAFGLVWNVVTYSHRRLILGLLIQSCVTIVSSLLTRLFPREHDYKWWRIQIPSNMTTIEELQGIVAGLVSVVKELTTNVSQVNHTVGNMAQSVPAASNSHSLRMPSIQLPSFCRDSVVQDDISEFLERFIQQTSHLPAETRLSLLEQQCVGDWPRSVLSIAKTTEGYTDEAAEEKLNICIERLRAEFGESKEDKCRRLATELSAIKQEHGESVEQFAFKYKKLLHQLEKLGEKITKDCPTFVISQFISKVNPLVVKASEFETLDKIVEAARRVELSFQTPPTTSNTNQSLDE